MYALQYSYPFGISSPLLYINSPCLISIGNPVISIMLSMHCSSSVSFIVFSPVVECFADCFVGGIGSKSKIVFG